MPTTKRRLPSLTALTAFEAAARYLSFKAAAGELNVTPAAVSRQIRNLEEDLGASLFHRLYRGVKLTPDGELLFETATAGFTNIAATADSIRSAPTGQRLSVGSTNAVASFWLLPRLKRFWARHPDINVDHVISDTPIDMRADQVDLWIRFGQGTWPGLESRYLFSDVIYAVCGADFMRARSPLARTDDLLAHPLLDIRVPEDWLDWATWLRQNGVNVRIPHPRHFNNYVIAVQAAVDNQGFALGWDSLVASLIAEGRLVRPLPNAMQSPGAFFLASPAGAPPTREAALFADWLQQEAADHVPGDGSEGDKTRHTPPR